jgi:acyl carrier protein
MEGAMDELIQELKVKIVDTLNLITIAPESIDAEAQLVGGDLGLDSIDVLELVMMIEKDYGLKIDNKELGIRVFASLKTLAEYIHQNRAETRS